MQNPKISVLMGIYNCAHTLPEALDSLLAQTFTEWQAVLCDDGSSDDTYLIALEYQKQHPEHFIVIRNEKNIRLAATLNHCAEYATGKYIARMDGDDISVETRFEEQYNFLEAHPEYDLVGTYMRAFDENGLRNSIPIKREPVKTDLPKFNPFHHATIMMKRELFESLGGYHISKLTSRAEDVDLWFRFFKQGYRGCTIDKELYLVREDVHTFNRRTLSHSFEASRLLRHGIKSLGLSSWYYIYALKPIVSQFTPVALKRLFRKIISR